MATKMLIKFLKKITFSQMIFDMKIPAFFALFFLFFAIPFELLSQLNANHDRGFWLIQSFNHNFRKEWFSRLRFEQRWGDDYKKLHFQRYGAFLFYDFKPRLEKKGYFFSSRLLVGPGCNFTRVLLHHNNRLRWNWRTEPLVEAFFLSSTKWKIGVRLRGEYIYHVNHSLQHRNHALGRFRLEIFSPWKLTQFKINPYLSNEWFYRKQTYSKNNPQGLVGGWFQNRFRAGVLFNIIEKLTTGFFWQWVTIKNRPGPPRVINHYQYLLEFDLLI